MKQFLRRFPLHSFLLGLYIISVVYVQNLDKLYFSSIFRSVAAILIFSVVVFALVYLFYRSVVRAGIFTTFVVGGLSLYGLIYDQLELLYYKGYWPFSHIHRVLIGIYFVFYLVLFFYLLRTKRAHIKTNFILNVLVLFVFVINIFSGLFSGKTSVSEFRNTFLNSSPVENRSLKVSRQTHPDVYFIVLDGYASEWVLNKYYGAGNNTFYDFLRSRGFYVADSSKADYPVTAESMASTLNLHYLDSIPNPSYYGLVQKNMVSEIFKRNGYTVRNIESGYSITNHIDAAGETVKLPSLNEFENRFADLTILRLDDVLGTRYYNRLISQFNLLPEMQKKGERPTFNFIHIVAPHPPYVLDSAGNRRVRTALSDLAWEPRELYVDQMKFVSQKVSAFIDGLMKDTASRPIIVVQSDHGPWLTESAENLYNVRLSILNAYLVPDLVKARLHPAISPVNTFRVLLPSLFQLPYNTLPMRPYPMQELEKHPIFKTYTKK